MGVIEKRPKVGAFVTVPTAPTTVAIVLPSLLLSNEAHHPHIPHIINGVTTTLPAKEFEVQIVPYREHCFWEDAGAMLLQRGVRDIVLWPSSITEQDVQAVLDRGCNVVQLGFYPKLAGLGLFTVAGDDLLVVRQIVGRMAALGHRRIAMVDYQHNPQRLKLDDLWGELCLQHGLDTDENLFLRLPILPEGLPDTSRLDQLFAGPPPTAVLVQDEYFAAAMFRLCQERGVDVPNDLSLAAVNDNSPYMHPVPLTAGNSIRVGRSEGQLAAQRIQRLRNGEQPSESSVLVRFDIEWRESIGPVSRHEEAPGKK